ncbi:hypothetical protein JZ751_028767, partial [Albula glossodonta]
VTLKDTLEPTPQVQEGAYWWGLFALRLTPALSTNRHRAACTLYFGPSQLLPRQTLTSGTTFITYISVKGGPVSSATGSVTLTHFSQEPSRCQTRTCRCSKMATLDLKLWYWGTEEEHILHWIHAAHHSAPCATCLLPNIIGTNEVMRLGLPSSFPG